MSTEKRITDRMKEYTDKITAPVIFGYVMWIISEAQKKGFSRIYFLARDGYALYETAKIITAEKNIPIDCRYLYCSRQSFRMPSYHFSGDEAFSLLLQKSTYNTAEHVLMRAELNSNERAEIYRLLDISEPEKILGDSEFYSLTEKLRVCGRFKELLDKKSAAAYEATVKYLRQEGLFDTDKVVIADSGWAGTMQRSLRQLLRNAGCSSPLYGFYFGLHATPKEPEDGEMYGYFFDKNSRIKHKVIFNNNVFECMLSALHPMTVGYEEKGGVILPAFGSESNEDMKSLIRCQLDGIISYAEMHKSDSFIYEKEIKTCYKLLKRGMASPTAEEAEMFGHFLFCDDTTDAYLMSLASPEMTEKLSEYFLPKRILSKLSGNKKKNSADLFWPYGVIPFCKSNLRWWYRLNVVLGEWLRYLMN